MILALIIVTVSFVFTGVYLAFDEPDYDSCYDKRAVPVQIETAEDCASYNGTWQGEYCDLYSACEAALEPQEDQFRFRVFISSFVIGAAILLGAIFLPIPILSASMMGSGIVTLLISVLGYWEKLGEIWRFVILGITLVALIWITVKKLK